MELFVVVVAVSNERLPTFYLRVGWLIIMGTRLVIG